MKKLMKTFKQISILFLAITFLGCEEDDAVLPQVEAGFTYTLNMDTGTVTFINTSTEATKYTWDFGDETGSSLIDPVKVYENGTYTVTLTASNVAGASDTFEDQITILIPEIATLPISFDGENTKYEPEVFSGASFEVVDNPDTSGTNTEASKVGAITNSGATFEGIAFELGAPINLSTDKTIKMDLWSDAPIDVLLKLEITETDFVEVAVSHSGTGWEELLFNFSASSTYPKLVLFVDGPGTSTGTFYIDNIEQIPTEIVPIACEAETMQSLSASDFNLTFMSDPSDSIGSFDAGFAWIDNPDADNDINKSCKVGQIDRVGSALFANNQIDLDAKLDFDVNSGFKMKVWSPNVGTNVLVKLEDQTNSDIFVQISAVTTVASEWEELTFPFGSSETGKHDKIIIFFELDTNTTETYYIDDFALYSDGTGGGGGGTTCTETALALPVDFDCDTIDYVAKDTGDVAFEVVDNPELSGINATPSKVGKMVFDSNQPWENMNLNLDTPIDFSTDKDITLKLFSTTTRVIKLKVETGGTPVENDQNHTGSGWEELTFTLPTAESFSNLVLFVDGGSNTTGTFYIDDIVQVSSGGGGGTGGGGGGTGECTAPAAGEFITDGDFEANAGCWELIDNGGEVTISTTISNGGSNSGQIKTAPTRNPALKQTRFGVGSIQPNTAYTVTFDIQANASNLPADGAVFQAFAFSEPAEGSTDPATQHILVAGDASFPTSWDTRTYTFTTGGNVDGGLSLLLELVCGGAATCTGTVNIDNVSITAN